jgi:hypothetical protein
MRRAIVTLALLLGGTLLAQESTSYKLSEHTVNAGGYPKDGEVLHSTSFRMTLSAIGDNLTPTNLSSSNYQINGGLVGSYPPPGEVANLQFTDATTLLWDVEPTRGNYNLYSGDVTQPFDPNYGVCQPPRIPTETTAFAATPALGEALFVLITVDNLIDEEGTKGTRSDGMERPNPVPCP